MDDVEAAAADLLERITRLYEVIRTSDEGRAVVNLSDAYRLLAGASPPPLSFVDEADPRVAPASVLPDDPGPQASVRAVVQSILEEAERGWTAAEMIDALTKRDDYAPVADISKSVRSALRYIHRAGHANREDDRYRSVQFKSWSAGPPGG